MGKIVVTRKAEFKNRLSRFSVIINGKESGVIKSGGIEEFDLAAGQQAIECKMNWYFSNKFLVDLKEKQTVYLLVRNNTKYLMIAFAFIISTFFISFVLEGKGYITQPVMKIIRLVYFVLMLIYFIYTLTLGRKRYLLIEPDTSNSFAK